jgi:hypothetical protein
MTEIAAIRARYESRAVGIGWVPSWEVMLADIKLLLHEVDRTIGTIRQLQAMTERQEQELAELDRENATLAGRANLAEEQLAARGDL